jgi:glycosyltransferase involved in cell wall biosynthesis
LVPGKGVNLVADAVKCWQQQGDGEAIFTVAGDGAEASLLAERLSTEISERKVRLLRSVTEAAKWGLYAESDVFLYPSTYDEGFPAVIVEALASGLPLIYTPVGALNEVLGPANGIRLEIGHLSGETIVQALRELQSNPERRRTMGTLNRRVAQEHYDLQVVTQRMVRIYQAVASRPLTS